MSGTPSESGPVKEVNLTIPILPNMEITATRTASSIAEYMDFDQERIDEVKIALIEAIINAFEHSQSRDGKVHIRFLMRDDNLTVIIQDHGGGFDPEDVEKPLLENKLHSNHKRGWGLMLIENLMDEVAIHSTQQGTTLMMSKNRK